MSRAEALLLALARDLATDLRTPAPPRPAETLAGVAAHYGPGSPLARALLEAARRAGRDERLALALAWAREHVRLALEDLVTVALDRGDVPKGLAPAGTLAWLLLAGLEALALEPSGAVADRVLTLTTLVGGRDSLSAADPGSAPDLSPIFSPAGGQAPSSVPPPGTPTPPVITPPRGPSTPSVVTPPRVMPTPPAPTTPPGRPTPSGPTAPAGRPSAPRKATARGGRPGSAGASGHSGARRIRSGRRRFDDLTPPATGR